MKPGGWATVVFHNTDADVWKVIRDAAEGAGFAFHEAASLDRQQQSHKGYKGRSGAEDVAHFDVVFNLRKWDAARSEAPVAETKKQDLIKVVAQVLKDWDVARNGLQGVHAEVMRRLASAGDGAFVDYGDVREAYHKLSRKSRSNKLAIVRRRFGSGLRAPSRV